MASDNGRKDAAAVIADLCGDPTMADEVRREVASENELKPCPFCGGKARMSAWVEQSEYSAYCTKCGATAGDYRATEAEAVAAWNRRDGVGVAKMETTTHGNTPTVREVLKAICDYWDYGFDNNDRTRHFSALAKDALAAEGATTKGNLGVGDAARMREACTVALDTILGFITTTARREDIRNAVKALKTALAAPPRNCDIVPIEAPEAADMFHRERPFHGYDYATHYWLLAPATEKEGGAK